MKEKILSDVESATSGNFTSADETESTEVRRRYVIAVHALSLTDGKCMTELKCLPHDQI